MTQRNHACGRADAPWPWMTLSFLFLTACSLPPANTTPPKPSSPLAGVTQTGVASWYGPGFHGRQTASGAIYNQHAMTAAHPNLPFGTRVMVTNLENGRSTEVAINDRGPFAKNRIIDLSYAAALNLEMATQGTAPVRLEVIESPPGRGLMPHYAVQVGSFVRIENAERLMEQLTHSYPRASRLSIESFQNRGTTYYRVALGPFSDLGEARGHAGELIRMGFTAVVQER